MSDAKERLKKLRVKLQKQAEIAMNGSVDLEMISKLHGSGSASDLLGMSGELHLIGVELDKVIAALPD